MTKIQRCIRASASFAEQTRRDSIAEQNEKLRCLHKVIIKVSEVIIPHSLLYLKRAPFIQSALRLNQIFSPMMFAKLLGNLVFRRLLVSFPWLHKPAQLGFKLSVCIIPQHLSQLRKYTFLRLPRRNQRKVIFFHLFLLLLLHNDNVHKETDYLLL